MISIRKYLVAAQIHFAMFQQQLNVNEVRKIFILAIRDYLSNTIKEQDLAHVAHILLYNEPIWNPIVLADKDWKLVQIMEKTENMGFGSAKMSNNLKLELERFKLDNQNVAHPNISSRTTIISRRKFQAGSKRSS